MKQYADIGRNINITDKYFRLFFRNALKPYRLNTAEGTVLLSLYGHGNETKQDILKTVHKYSIGNYTQDQLIDELHYDRGVMTRTMKSLEKKGYVIRYDNPSDCRSYIFCPSKKALSLKPKLIGILYDWNKSLLSDIDCLELSAAQKALSVMSQNAMNKFEQSKGEK